MVLRPRLARRSNSVTLAADGPASGGADRRRSSSMSGGEGVPLSGCSTGGMRTAGTGPTPHDLTSWDASSVSAISKKTNTPEFLLKLYRILQQEDPGIIQWDNGRIHVRNPHVLGQDVLHKYFRHSKYSSFQRQLNYFGFRKTQGKGKMSACTYTNAQLEGGTLKSLLGIKRKTSGTPKNGTSNSDTDEREEPDTSLSDDDSSMDGAHATSSLPPPFKRQRSVSSSAEASDYTVAGCCSMSDSMSTATSPLSSCCPSAAPSREASAEVPVGVAFFSPGSVPPAFSSTIPLNITRPFVVTSGALSLPTQSFSMNCQRQGFEAPVIDPTVFNQSTTAPLPTPSPRNADDLALFYGFPGGFDLDCDMSWCEPPALGSLSSFDPESPRPQSASEQPSLEAKPVVKAEAAPTGVWSTVPMIQLPQSQPAQQQMQPQEGQQLAQQVPGVSSGEETPAGSVSVTAPTSALDPDFWSKLPIDPFCLPISPRYVAI